MLVHLILLATCLCFGCTEVKAGYINHTSINGEVWPKPQMQRKHQKFYYYRYYSYTTWISYYNCEIVGQAIERYTVRLNKLNKMVDRSMNKSSNRSGSGDPHYAGFIKALEVHLTEPCEDYPYLDMDESYNLTVSETSRLTSASVWGILRGLETWLQLFYINDDFNALQINSTEIVDYPKYKHRGLLIDTGRHYITLSNILVTLDALEMNKMNVLHWHIVDDQSFPYQSKVLPKLSRKGAFHPRLVYTKDNIKSVIEYARDRGIRVIPEFDVPGHTLSWGKSIPKILTKCYQNGKVKAWGPLNPISTNTYKVLMALFKEVQARFPDKYIHIGGDEVDFQCWKSNPKLQTYGRTHGKSANQMYSMFINKAISLLENKSTPIVWQEVFDENVPLSNDTLIQVWKNRWNSEMFRILLSGHRLLFSSTWYLDHLNNGWEYFYRADPRQMVYELLNSDTMLHNIVGGEACMWSESVDNSNIISRIWPRTCAVAERLWSGLDYKAENMDPVTNEVRSRLMEHTCRMNRRGVLPKPSHGPGFCGGVH